MSLNSHQEIQILHVDDDPSITDLTGTFLERDDERFTVETATSADEGLENITDSPPDCVVSDYNMPGTDGIEFLQAVREEYPDLPFILFTGKGSETVASDAIAAGVTDYLQKESGSEQYELLANRIENAVHARRESQRADQQEQLMRLTEFAGGTGGFEIDVDSGDLLLTDGTHRLAGLADDAQITLEEAIELYHPDDQADVRQTVTRAAETGEETHGTWRLQTLDGDERLVDVTITPVTENDDVTTLRGAVHDVTERKERERELARTNDLMANMEQLADVGAWEYDPATETVEMTDGTRRIHGLEPGADLALEEAFKYVHPEDRERLTDGFTECLETDEPYEVDVRLITAEGTQRWATARGERVDKPGSDSVVRGYIRDVTEEKTRERQLTELNQALRDLLTAETRQQVADIGARAARDVLDLRANAVHLCEDDDTLTPVAQTDEVISHLGEVPALSIADSIAGRVYQRGDPTVVEDAPQDPDVYNSETDLKGHIYLPLADHGVLIAGSKEKLSFDQQDVAFGELLAGNLVAAFDRIDREQTARQRRERLSLFFEESPLGAVQWDDEFQFERVNRRAEEILGYSEAELRGESWETVVAEEDRGQVGDAVEALLAAGGGTEVLNRNVRKDGEVLTCEWHNRAITDENGEVKSVFSKFQDVTDRERRRTELEEYGTIIGALNDAVYVLDEEGRFTYVNDEFVELVGYDRETILGNTPSLIKDEEGVQRAEQELGRLLSSDGPDAVTFEVMIQPREGDPIVCEDHMGVLSYEGEEFDGSVGTLRDITERKDREQKLRRTLALLDHTERMAQVGGWEADIETGEAHLTDGAYRIGDLSPNGDLDPTVESTIEFYHPDDRDTVERAVQRCMNSGESYDEELRLITDENRLRWMRTTGEPVYEGENIVKIRGAIRDITESKEHERELKRTRKRLDLGLDAADAGVWVLDLQTEELIWDDRTQRLWGYEPDEFEGSFEEFADRVHPEDWPELESTYKQAIKERSDYQIEFRVEPADEPVRWIEARGEVVVRDSEPHRLVGIALDVTDRQVLARQLEVFDRVLRHNLKNSMTVIRGSAETIEEQTEDEMATWADNIVEESDRLLGTIDKQRELVALLIERPVPIEVDLVAYLEEEINRLASRHPAARIDLNAPPEASIIALPQIRRAVRELIENAIVHHDGEPEVEITIEEVNETILIQVADDGPGIPEQEVGVLTKDRIEPLYHGSGLGLRLVSWIVGQSGGEVQFDKDESRGSVVTVELPRDK